MSEIETFQDSSATSPDPIKTSDGGDSSAEGSTVVEIQEEPSSRNVIQEYEVFVPVDKKTSPEVLNIPSGDIDEVRRVISEGPNIRLDDNSAGRDWIESVRESTDILNLRNVYKSTVDRPNSEFAQTVPSEKSPLVAGIPNLNFNTGEKVAGERAVLRVRGLLGLGTVLQIPLWHSGFWLTMKAPSEASLLELQRRLIEAKVNLGRQTHGLSFANTSSYVAGWLIDFVIAHVYDTTIKGGEVELRKMIQVLDLPTIVWGLACTIWPAGFKYTRACIVNPEKCNHVVRDKINLSKLLWVDRKVLTPWQISHMANRGGSTMSIEAIERYREEFTIGRGRSISFQDDKLTINFKTPNIEAYVNSGHKWINNIIAMIDGSFTEESNPNTRNVYITEHGKATNMRQYSHWIESIDAGGTLIDDTESIESIVDTLSAVDDIRDLFFKEVIKFIDDSTMSVIAVPSFECPACQQQQPANLPRFPHLLPIDTISSFFTLLVQKLQRIHTR